MIFNKEFRLDHPETIGETDKMFDLNNYSEWLEQKLLEARKQLTLTDVVKSLPTKEEIEYRAEQALFGFQEKSRKFDDDYYFGYCNGAEWIKKEITK